MTLNEFFKENPKTALAFSGGVDSAVSTIRPGRPGQRYMPTM